MVGHSWSYMWKVGFWLVLVGFGIFADFRVKK